ncbi:hypothetical protein EPUS_05335 [Endocarpon pusillum Z07020]|uniref:Uncharacterized protein n=1 Tax=Endocarpon pusillum (strain Z07020 / HMAS-L-300199) TaxID=1263415 RepID=U1GGP7_ENDPU|nr:uncharacterized protein EPUS_05335 [Endocarpon pusillum Z07020]ERF71283.1 hypothetical protein EPUS_05335 [Endocarpon pusillum Z07020]
MKFQEDYYDPDEDVKPSSPGLVPTQINYEPENSPPPYFPVYVSSSGSSSPEPDTRTNNQEGYTESAHVPVKKKLKRKRRRKGRTRPSQGDAVLIHYLDPNRPDIAREVAQHALNSASQSEVEDETERDISGDGDGEDDDGGTKDNYRDDSQATALTSKAQAVLHDVYIVSASIAMHGAMNGTIKKHSLDNGAASHTSLNALHNPEASLKSLYPHSPLKFVPTFPEGRSEIEDESITKSPALARFAIFAAETDPDSTLPAIQKSPPQSMSSQSPNGIQSLPSLQTTLGQIIGTPIADTPYPSHPSFWRDNPKEVSFGTISPPASVPDPIPTSSYPTSKENASPESSTTSQSLNFTNRAIATTAFKCTY